MTPLLQGKSAVVYVGGGQISHALAHEGAGVSLAGRTLAKLHGLAGEVRAAGVPRS